MNDRAPADSFDVTGDFDSKEPVILPDELRASPKLFADETTAPMAGSDRGCTKTGQLWAYASDD